MRGNSFEGDEVKLGNGVEESDCCFRPGSKGSLPSWRGGEKKNLEAPGERSSRGIKKRRHKKTKRKRVDVYSGESEAVSMRDRKVTKGDKKGERNQRATGFTSLRLSQSVGSFRVC